MELTKYTNQYQDFLTRFDSLKRVFDLDAKREKLEEVNLELENPDIWRDQEKLQQLNKAKSALNVILEKITKLEENIKEMQFLLEELRATPDEEFLPLLDELNQASDQLLQELEFQKMFNQELDANNCYLEIQSGSGGTESQDWAEMLLRMYLRWTNAKGFKTEILEVSTGEVAGIKSASIHVIGNHAFGWLRTELGVHRLVRKSPFDSNNKRHTSFASVFISPEIDDNIEIDIKTEDLRIDTYRSSGAGGQHVNKTDSAVRITHLPTNTVAQCQNGRSQHQNKDEAMKQLRAKLYELEMLKKHKQQQLIEENKSDISWGSQIRSYVLDSGRIKDLRTGIENNNTQAVLDGDLDKFIEASLKAGV